jgi:8-oxo-dGTP pyrophosphatase MutT (NUDIX family)
MVNMRVEISCGAVLFTEIDRKRFYVLVSANAGDNCGLPKGHVEGNETEKEAALREIKEETGVSAKIIDGFRKQIEYMMPNGILKNVVYFIARFADQEARSNEPDISTVTALPFHEAVSAVTFDSVRDVLTAAENWLSRERGFEVPLTELQPSQLYISQHKMQLARGWFGPEDRASFDPIPVKLYRGRYMMTDGHTRAVVAALAGWETVPVTLDDDPLDLLAYAECVRWCDEAGLKCAADLTGRIISHEDYETLWHKRCDDMETAGYLQEDGKAWHRSFANGAERDYRH